MRSRLDSSKAKKDLESIQTLFYFLKNCLYVLGKKLRSCLLQGKELSTIEKEEGRKEGEKGEKGEKEGKQGKQSTLLLLQYGELRNQSGCPCV